MKPVAAADRTTVAEGNNIFAVALYGRLRHQSGNLFFSPESISTALAMAYAGARGGTAIRDGENAALHAATGKAASGHGSTAE